MLQMQQSIFLYSWYTYFVKGRKGSEKMKVIKRDGHMVDYSPDKIENAVNKANLEVQEEDQASSTQIRNIIKGQLSIFFLNSKACILARYNFYALKIQILKKVYPLFTLRKSFDST